MLPSKVSFKGYKCFKEEQFVRLRPLTVVMGFNSSGKSAALRAVKLIGDSVQSVGMGPINLNSEAVGEASFEQLRWLGSGAVQSMDFGLTWEQAVIKSYKWSVFYEDNLLKVKSCNLRGSFNVDWSMDLPYNLRWVGAKPVSVDSSNDSAYEALSEQLLSLGKGVQWLRATRKTPQRLSKLPFELPLTVGSDGDGCVQVLLLYPDVLERVSDFYYALSGREVTVRAESAGVSIKYGGVDLCDVGEGLIQVLPVLTALNMLIESDIDGPNILAIEEPESHLHPSLQSHLMESFIGQVRTMSERGCCVVLETHSEHILRSLQLALLEGRITNDDFAVHWVESSDGGDSISHITEVCFDDLARPDRFPERLYEDVLDVQRKLLSAQIKRGRA